MAYEIAACKGFQIVDWREELDELFEEDEIVTFKSMPDLFEKVEYFTEKPELRKPYIEKLYAKVSQNYSWEDQVKIFMENILD